MSNGEPVLAPTPIVRMTSEQLEYLISRLRPQRWKLSGLRSNEITIGTSAISNGIAIGVNRARKLLVLQTYTGGPYVVTSTNPPTGNTGFLVQGTTQGPIILSVDEWGWQLTQPWYYNITTAGISQLNVTELFGPPNVDDL